MGAYACAQAGSPDALAALVRQHIPLVQALVKRFSYHEDAFQQGCMGLVTAIRRFKEDAGVQFSTYAVPVILGEMRRAFSHTAGWRARASLRKIEQARFLLQTQLQREPTLQELSALSHVPGEEILLLLERTQPLQYDETGLFLSSLPDPDALRWMDRFLLRDILERLPPEDQQLLYLRYQHQYSQGEVAKRLRTTQSSVSRRESALCRYLRVLWLE